MKLKDLKQKRATLEAKIAELKPVLDSGEITTEQISELSATQSELDNIAKQISDVEALEARLKTRPVVTDVKDLSADRKWESGGEFLQAVLRADTGQKFDPRLQNHASGMNEGVSSEGGFLVGTDFSNQLWDKAYSLASIAADCFPVPISTNANGTTWPAVSESSRVDGSRHGGVRAYWTAEAGEIVSSKAKLERIELKLKKLAALCYATEENLEDAAQLEQMFNELVPAEMAVVLDEAILTGTGVGSPLGVLKADCLVSQAAEGSQTQATVNMANITKMYSRVPPRSMARAKWYINQSVFPQILSLASAATSAATPMFIEPGKISSAPNGAIFGRPIVPIEQCEALGTVGDILFADFSQYALARKGGIKAATSLHVRFVYDEQAFKFTMRVDGRPMWTTALTPKKGSATISPFVALAAR